MAVDLTEYLPRIVRQFLGLRDADPARGLGADTAELWRFGLWRAAVQAMSSNGQTVDVQPEDPRIPAAQNVPVRFGVPNLTSLVEGGSASMLLGWEGGDQSKPYAVPAWDSGATVNENYVNSPATYFGIGPGGSGVDPVATKKDLEFLYYAITHAVCVPNDGGVSFQTTLALQLSFAGWSQAVSDGNFCAGSVQAKR